MDDRAARGGLPPLADVGTPDVGAPDDSRNRFSGHHLLCRPQAAEKTRFDGRGRPRTQADVRQTGHSPRRADGAGGRGGRCRDGLGVGQDDVQGGAGRKGHRLLFDLRGAARLPRPGEEIPGQRRPLYRQFLCGAQCRGLLRRIVLLHPAGCPLSDGAVDLFPDQCGGDGTVRTYADRGRRRGLRELSGGVYGSSPRRKPAACRRGGDHRRERRRGQIFDGAELVSGRQGGPGRHL